MRGIEKNAKMWAEVAERVKKEGWRDQAKINQALDSETLREPKAGEPRTMRFVGANGVRTEVLRPGYYWGHHLGWCVGFLSVSRPSSPLPAGT